MKSALLTASTFALVGIALLALLLAGFGALPASIALLAFVASAAGFALLASRTVKIEIVEEIEIYDLLPIEYAPAPVALFVTALATAFVALSVSLPFAALVITGFGVAL